ncbi:hypothetical protein JCM10212_004332 [Sporobolomyces blumeae]
MLLRSTLFASTDSSDASSGLFQDFPAQCTDPCNTMEGIVAKCAALPDSTTEQEATDCACTTEFGSALEACGGCIVPAAGLSSESGNVIAQIAIGYSRTCGLPLQIEGVDGDVSSILANPTQSGSPTQAASSTASDASTTAATSAATSTGNTAAGSSSETTSPSSTATAAPSATPSDTSSASLVRPVLASIGLAIVALAPVLSPPSPQLSSHGPTMSSGSKIPNMGSLGDRIARLNLAPTSSPSSSPARSASPGRSSSPTAVRTGAVTKISDKISKFQENAEERPILPRGGGSFTQAPARPTTSKDKDDKQRVVSLGAGRASVPIAVVKSTRSVSAGTGSRAASEAGSVGSGETSSRAGTPSGSRDETDSAQGASVPSTSVTSAPSSSASESPVVGRRYSGLLPPEPRTPGAMSVSSMNVETGSITSEGGRTASEAEVTPSLSTVSLAEPPQLATPTASDSPMLALASSASTASSEDVVPARASSPTPGAPGKGPLDALRQPSRSTSVASMSSLVVEAPPEDVADLDGISTAGNASTTSEPPMNGSVTPTPAEETDDHANDEPDERRRLERTNAELTKYEADEMDPTAHGPGPEPREEDGQELPVRPTWVADGSENGQDEAPGMPKVKCSDCSAEVDLVELADHSCSPSQQASPQLSSPAPPENRRTELRPPSSDVPSDDLSTVTPTASTILPASPGSRNLASSSREDKLDSYVPQTDSVVPDDISPDDDVLDFYGDDEPSQAMASPDAARGIRTADVPADEDESDGLDPTTSTSSATPMSRSQSHPTARAPRAEPAASRSHSVYGGSMPGLYSTDDEDDSYQGGTVTIVRSNR